MASQTSDQITNTTKNEIRRDKKQKNTPVSQLTRQELEARFLQLEAHNKQLQNLLARSQGVVNETSRAKKERPFDFSKHCRRHVLLKFAYLGWDYCGFAVQEDTQRTIEAQLFSALLKTRLIESRETSNYHRCGRTDKGVSAFDQVISITLRSRLTSGVGVIKDDNASGPPGDDGSDSQEINYVLLLNKVLPPEIRMLAWCPVAEGFSARFDCSSRTYKYFFPRGSLDIKLMNEAAQHLVGSHDYRNFCKMDVGNGVVNFCRSIATIDVSEVEDDINTESKNLENEIRQMSVLSQVDISQKPNDKIILSHERTRGDSTEMTADSNSVNSESCSGYNMCVATIRGQAFLWHQVRAIMAILFLVGERKESPDIVQELLDVEKHPRKPQYCLASDVPLNLYETTFDGVEWHWNHEVLRSVISQLQTLWTQHSVRATMIRQMLRDVESRYMKMECEVTPATSNEVRPEVKTTSNVIPRDQCESLVPGARTKVYRPLLSRPTCESLETRVEHYVKRQRLDPDILQKVTTAQLPSEDSAINSNE